MKISGDEVIRDDNNEKNWFELRVEDNGIGFDMKYLDKIFRPLERLHGPDEYEGTGMGLVICRKIAQRHGGAITARRRIGIGSTFIVYLPKRQTYDRKQAAD